MKVDGMTFADLIAGADEADSGLTVTVPESWHQGRTAYGGFSAALALAAAQRAGGAGLPPLRSAQFAMIAPVAGAVTAQAQVVRRGRNATWIEARLTSGGALAFSASLVFMGPVESTLHLQDRPAPEGYVPLDQAPPIRLNPHSPAFLVNHLEARHGLPPAASPRAEVCRWVRPKDWQGLDPMVSLMLTADGLPPAVMPLLSAPVPVSTMHWQVNLLTPAPVTRDGWWLLRSEGDHAEKGCSSQRMGLWNADGAAVLTGMQSVALFG